jgi:pentatricopeptide repeat protein
MAAMSGSDGVSATLQSYTAGLSACKHTGDWQRALQLLSQLKAAGHTPDWPVYTAAIDTLHSAQRHCEADALYAEMLGSGLAQHWSSAASSAGMLDFHGFSIGMAPAALRLVLRDMCSAAATAAATAAAAATAKKSKRVSKKRSTSSSAAQHVHSAAEDLIIITGHALTRDDRDGSVLQPVILSMLQQLGIVCTLDPTNVGKLIVDAAQLQQYVARQQQEQQQ